MCDSGYSPTSPTDNTCVRDCAPGNGDPIYYSDGNVCWPYCPPHTTIDIGPSCTKKSYTRQPNLWISPVLYTDLSGRKVSQRTDDNGTPSSKPGCPPGFQAIKSTTQKYQPQNTDYVVSCYPTCIPIALWNAQNAYAIGDYASYNELSYIALNNIVGSLSNLNPSLDTTNWMQKTTDLILSESGECYPASCPNNERNGGKFIADNESGAPPGACLRGDYNGGEPYNDPGPTPPDMAITRNQYRASECSQEKFYSLYTYNGDANNINNIVGATRSQEIPQDLLPDNPNFDNYFKCSYNCAGTNDIRLPNMKCYNLVTKKVGQFVDPVLEEPSYCGFNSGNSSLWGQSKITPDVNGLGPGYSDEYVVGKVVNAIGAQLWVPNYIDQDGVPGYRAYGPDDPVNVSDVVYLFKDERQWVYFDELGHFHPTVASDPRARTNPMYLRGIAPFFRCNNDGTQQRPNWTQPDPNTVPNGIFMYGAGDYGPFNPSDYPVDFNWAYTEIPNTVTYFNAVRFGDRNFNKQLCNPVSGFCPMCCIDDCPGPTNPATQEGFYEKDFRYRGGPLNPDEIIASVCYPRCAPGNEWRSQSAVCLPYTPNRTIEAIPGYSYCPIRLKVQSSFPTISNLFGQNLEQPPDAICLTPCDAGYEIKNENPYNICIATCGTDLTTSLIDGGDRCNKVPYTKSQQPSQANSTIDIVTRTEENLNQAASVISKISLQNGVSNIIFIVAAVVVICLIIVMTTIFVRRNQAFQGM